MSHLQANQNTRTAQASVRNLTRLDGLPDEFAVAVTQAHIDAGECESPWMCALALPIQEQFPGMDIELTGQGTLYINSSAVYRAHGARAFVRAFDRDRRDVSPERFVFRRVA